MHSQYKLSPDESSLGKQVAYHDYYNPELLFPISRKNKRDEIGVSDVLPFFGFDVWNHYEVSWLNEKGKPIAAIAEIMYGCESPCIIESKSLKLYFNAFNNTKFKDLHAVETLICKDLEGRIGSNVTVIITPINRLKETRLAAFDGVCLDELDIECSCYLVEPTLLTVENEMVEETLYSDLLKSNCLITNQPDWASIQIIYKGQKIQHAGLLQYLVSFRNHNEFHEQCIERIFMDIMRRCKPQELTVYGRFTRRGGIDINPYRTTNTHFLPMNPRLYRQ